MREFSSIDKAKSRAATPRPAKHYSTARQVRERYGNRSAMWIYRILKNDPVFPRPFTTGKNGKLRLWDDDELDAYDAARKLNRIEASTTEAR